MIYISPSQRGFHKLKSTPLVTGKLNYSRSGFTPNRDAVEEVFIKVTRVEALTMMRLVFFLSQNRFLRNISNWMNWAVGVAKDTLRTGIDLISTTV